MWLITSGMCEPFITRPTFKSVTIIWCRKIQTGKHPAPPANTQLTRFVFSISELSDQCCVDLIGSDMTRVPLFSGEKLDWLSSVWWKDSDKTYDLRSPRGRPFCFPHERSAGRQSGSFTHQTWWHGCSFSFSQCMLGLNIREEHKTQWAHTEETEGRRSEDQ